MLNEIDEDDDMAQVINRDARSSPLLLLCYTNHALDQFLMELISRIDTEALAEETHAGAAAGRRARQPGARETLNSGIVRIGNRSKDPVLEQYTLRALRDQLRAQRNVPFYLHRGVETHTHTLLLSLSQCCFYSYGGRFENSVDLP